VKDAAAVTAKADAGEGVGAALVLWAGILGPPVVFLVDLTLSYALAYWACSSGHRVVLDLVTLCALAIVFLCGWNAWRLLEGSPGADPQGGHRGDRTRFMAQVGLLTSALFTLAVLAFAVPRLVIGPCYP
jgi:hypothetical protein